MNRRVLLVAGFVIVVFAVSFAVQWHAAHEAAPLRDSPGPPPVAARAPPPPPPVPAPLPAAQSQPRDLAPGALVPGAVVPGGVAPGAAGGEKTAAPVPDKSTLPEVPVDVLARRIPPRTLGRHELSITSKSPDAPLQVTVVLLSQANGSQVQLPLTLDAGATVSIGPGDGVEIGQGDTVTLKSPGYRDSVTVVR